MCRDIILGKFGMFCSISRNELPYICHVQAGSLACQDHSFTASPPQLHHRQLGQGKAVISSWDVTSPNRTALPLEAGDMCRHICIHTDPRLWVLLLHQSCLIPFASFRKTKSTKYLLPCSQWAAQDVERRGGCFEAVCHRLHGCCLLS